MYPTSSQASFNLHKTPNLHKFTFRSLKYGLLHSHDPLVASNFLWFASSMKNICIHNWRLGLRLSKSFFDQWPFPSRWVCSKQRHGNVLQGSSFTVISVWPLILQRLVYKPFYVGKSASALKYSLYLSWILYPPFRKNTDLRKCIHNFTTIMHLNDLN